MNMARIISFALGNIWRWEKFKNRDAFIKYAKKLDINGIELTFATKEELFSFKLSSGNEKFLKSLEYVTIHSPFDFDAVEPAVSLEDTFSSFNEPDDSSAIFSPTREEILAVFNEIERLENLLKEETGEEARSTPSTLTAIDSVEPESILKVDEKNNSIDLTDKGIDFLSADTGDKEFFVLPDMGVEVAELEKQGLAADEQLAKKDLLMQDYAVKSERVHTVNQLLKAYTLFEKDVEYVVEAVLQNG